MFLKPSFTILVVWYGELSSFWKWPSPSGNRVWREWMDLVLNNIQIPDSSKGLVYWNNGPQWVPRKHHSDHHTSTSLHLSVHAIRCHGLQRKAAYMHLAVDVVNQEPWFIRPGVLPIIQSSGDDFVLTSGAACSGAQSALGFQRGHWLHRPMHSSVRWTACWGNIGLVIIVPVGNFANCGPTFIPNKVHQPLLASGINEPLPTQLNMSLFAHCCTTFDMCSQQWHESSQQVAPFLRCWYQGTAPSQFGLHQTCRDQQLTSFWRQTLLTPSL